MQQTENVTLTDFSHLVSIEFTGPVFKSSMEQNKTKKTHHTIFFFPPRTKEIQVQYVCVLPSRGGRRFYLTDKMSTGGDSGFRVRD